MPASARTLLATASHEIRAPVHTVLGMSELLAQTTLTPSQRQYVDALRRAASSLATLLDDILDLSKLSQQGDQPLRAERLWLPDLAHRVIEVVRTRAEEKGLILRVSTSDRVPKSVLGDLVRLQQVLVNLVMNGIKYTSAGEVSLDVDGVADGPVAHLVFSVKDTGPGIPADRLNGIFEAWERLPEHGHIEGLGLGLAISRRLVDAMGGTIDVESQTTVPTGSTFKVSITLPIARSSSTTSSSMVAVRALRFLVVGPDNVYRDVVAALAAWSPRVERAADESEAERLFHVALAKNEPYHVVVLDSELPWGGALAFGSTLLGRAIVLIVLEARALADIGNLVEEVGATPLLLPITTSAIYGVLDRALALRETKKTPLPDALPELAGHVVHAADDDGDARVLLRAFLEGSGLEVRVHETTAALLAAVREAPDRTSLVVCDVEMAPDEASDSLRGAAYVLEELKKDARCAGVPVVALTAHSDERLLESLRARGFAEVVRKPFSRTALIDVVHRRARVLEDAAPGPSTDLQLEARMALARRDHRALELLASKLPPKFTRAFADAARKRDDAGVREILRALDAERSPGVVIESIDDAIRELLPDYLRRRTQDARDIADAVAAGRFDNVAFIGHRMAGTGTTFGLPQLSELGAKLEVAGKRRDASEIATQLAALQALLVAIEQAGHA